MKFGAPWSTVRRLHRELDVLRRILRHPRTPRVSRILLAAAVGYAALPFDVIPDWVPLLGYLDDLIIVSGLIALGLLLVPREVIAECRQQNSQ